MLDARRGEESWSAHVLVRTAAQPQEDHQQEVMEKDVVYHGVFLPFEENEDKLPDSQAGELSAR